MTEAQLIAQLGDQYGSLTYTRKKDNPYLATSADGLNMAYGKTREQALTNLISGIERRKHEGA